MSDLALEFLIFNICADVNYALSVQRLYELSSTSRVGIPEANINS
jgi:hypothetical protein